MMPLMFFTAGNLPLIGSIWSIKPEYIEGESYYVLVVDEAFDFEGEYFIRVRPISFQVDMAATDDQVYEQKDLFRDPFLAPYWNEQPISLGILDEGIGQLQTSLTVDIPSKVNLTLEQKAFRSQEITNTAILREAVWEALERNEEFVTEVYTAAEEPLAMASYASYYYEQEPPVHNNSGNKKVYGYLAIAAIFFAIAFILWPSQIDKEAIIQEYALAYPLEAGLLEAIDERGGFSGSGSILRDSECLGIAYLTEEECLQVTLAIQYYENGDYDSTANILKEVLQPFSRSYDLGFYLAISELIIEDSQAATEHLKELNGINDFPFEQAVDYYLSLALIVIEDYDEAAKILNGILLNQEHEYFEQAGDILRMID